MRVCIRCGESKDEQHFKKDLRRLGGLTNHCKTCHNKDARIAREKDPEKFREYSRQRRLNNLEKSKEYHKKYILRTLFGISLESFREKLKEQDNLCAICGNPEWLLDHRNGKPYLLSVDHNHTTKTVRDLLCRRCNTVFGTIEESPDLAAALLDYALRWEGK